MLKRKRIQRSRQFRKKGRVLPISQDLDQLLSPKSEKIKHCKNDLVLLLQFIDQRDTKINRDSYLFDYS